MAVEAPWEEKGNQKKLVKGERGRVMNNARGFKGYTERINK